MLILFEIPLFFPADHKANPNMGSVFHGALMELVGKDAAEMYHNRQVRPYSQSIIYRGKTRASIWRLGLFSESDCNPILQALQKTKTIYLRQQKYTVSLGKPSIRTYTLDEWLGTHGADGAVPQGAIVHFYTTTSFKRQGSYVLFPEPRLLYQSVVLRWNTLSGKTIESGLEDVLDYYTIIHSYRLQTELFHLEGRSVTGFSGQVELRFTGNDTACRYAAILLSCAEFTGFGIKTALGMGAAHVEIKTKKVLK
ncbi:CRISPR system precrRNA processing endoribonuclease RAMP protein Cas6 [Megasphaera hexanoica]|uniref:CRISPR system precrRNA processing endoribonuclease RAMP protein Cas6 n=1 Tax=Megasphaera hexanoica TaxID=1675036 RepID=A0A848BUU0_9FIRM|nr:CRISPR system precrRNA processing endoribonuclease RAMP protein Cas6 [Megasphaera hexanoica]NME28990.1 CRISPR system precrRNA processing endoribonuclease RAMP protein Cas6 [Megasphaera hexanoica]